MTSGPRGNALPDAPASYRRRVRVGSSSHRVASENARFKDTMEMRTNSGHQAYGLCVALDTGTRPRTLGFAAKGRESALAVRRRSVCRRHSHGDRGERENTGAAGFRLVGNASRYRVGMPSATLRVVCPPRHSASRRGRRASRTAFPRKDFRSRTVGTSVERSEVRPKAVRQTTEKLDRSDRAPQDHARLFSWRPCVAYNIIIANECRSNDSGTPEIARQRRAPRDHGPAADRCAQPDRPGARGQATRWRKFSRRTGSASSGPRCGYPESPCRRNPS